ncbi:MAG: hypothetical protein GY737_21090 [Desulfobacteraceae bacterium]|nr:hypothetical protein [Desulfobacteraceae bacterium]
MIAKNITGIIIISLNLAGICFMVLMLLMALINRGKPKKVSPAKGRKKPTGKPGQKPKASLSKADYLLDDIDLSEFDDLDLDEME